MTVIFLSRFMLDLRGIHFGQRTPGAPGAESTFSGPGKMSDICFDTSRIVGNLGATLSYPDFDSNSRSSVSYKPSRNTEHCGEIEEVERGGLGCRDEEWQWYGDEKLVYVDDPFKAGLLRQPPVVVDIMELEEPLSPLSPISPVSAMLCFAVYSRLTRVCVPWWIVVVSEWVAGVLIASVLACACVIDTSMGGFCVDAVKTFVCTILYTQKDIRICVAPTCGYYGVSEAGRVSATYRMWAGMISRVIRAEIDR